MTLHYQRKVMSVLVSLAAACLLALCWAEPVSAEVSIDRLVEICEKGTAEELEAAIAAGVEVNARDQSGGSPLVAAISSNVWAEEKTALLLKAGADPNLYDPEVISGPPLSLAASKGRVAVVKMLLEAGAEINVLPPRGYAPMFWGCMKFPMIDPEDDPQAYAASEDNRRRMFQLFLDKGADLTFDQSGAKCLVMVAADGELETVRLMLKAGVPVNGTDVGVTTALMMAAAFNSDPKIVALLLENGADPEMRDWQDITALDYARGNIPALKTLSEMSPDYAKGTENPAAGEIIRLLEAAQKQ